jgi:hypothetical protein
MNYVPRSLSRFGYRNILKLQKNSPTILVVGGVVGLGVTAVLAAKATRSLDPILDKHAKQRIDIAVDSVDARDEQKMVVKLYGETAIELAKLYGPTLVVGTLSATSVLHGHKILKGRHLATMAAYTGLMEQYKQYRARVAETVGPELERSIFGGAIGRWEEDPEHPGEYKMQTKEHTQPAGTYLRPFFDEANSNWTPDPASNYLFLKGVQAHCNRLLDLRGYLFLFEVYDALGMDRTKETIVSGWVLNGDGDGFVDFGFMTDPSPQAVMFRNGAERSVRLNFNIDGVIWDLI